MSSSVKKRKKKSSKNSLKIVGALLFLFLGLGLFLKKSDLLTQSPTLAQPSRGQTPEDASRVDSINSQTSPLHPQSDTSNNSPNPSNDGFDFKPKQLLKRSISERFGRAEIKIQGPIVQESKVYSRTKTVYLTDFKFSLLKVTDRFEKESEGAPPTLISRVVEVADHLIVKIKTQALEADFEKELKHHGFSIRKKMNSARLYLVQFEASTIDASEKAKETLMGSSLIEAVDPDYIVSTN